MLSEARRRLFLSAFMLAPSVGAGCSGSSNTSSDASSDAGSATSSDARADTNPSNDGGTPAQDASDSSSDSSSNEASTPPTEAGVGAPVAPTEVKAFSYSPGMEAAYVVFAAPSDSGASPITEYTATSNPGGFTGVTKLSDYFNSTINGVSARVYVEGLTGGTPYTFTVTATNANGTSLPSAASNSVTPAPYADYFVYNGALYGGGINPAWGNYDFGGTFDFTSTAVAPPAGYGSIVLSQSGSGSGLQPYNQHVDPFHPTLTNQNNGQFDLVPFTYLTSYIYPTAAGQDFDTYVEYQVLFSGVVTAASADSIIDSTQHWTPGTVTGGTGALWWNDTAGTWGGITGSNTANTQPTQSGAGGFSVGDFYEFGPVDQPLGTHVSSVAQYVKSPNAGTFTANQWNLMQIPLTAFDDPGKTNVSKGRILKFGMQEQNSGATVYYAGLGFSR